MLYMVLLYLALFRVFISDTPVTFADSHGILTLHDLFSIQKKSVQSEMMG